MNTHCDCGEHVLWMDGLLITSLTDTTTCPSSSHTPTMCRFLTPVDER